MRIGSSVLALTVASFLFTSVAPAGAQEIPQPLFGSCCGCKGQIKIVPGPRLDILGVGARIIPTPTAIIDPIATGLSVEISNANGTIITASIPPGAFIEKKAGQKFVFKDKDARKNGGIATATVQERFDSEGGWLVSIRAFGDLSAATLPEMTTQIVIGTSPFFDTSVWSPRGNGWRQRFPE